MKHALSFLMEFPETEQGKTNFESIFNLAENFGDREILSPSALQWDGEELLTYPKIQGEFRFISQDDFNSLFNLLNELKENVLVDSCGYIRCHECVHPDGPCPAGEIDSWGSEEI